MKKILLLSILLFLCACGAKKTNTKISAPIDNPTWKQYLTYCGESNTKAKLNFKEAFKDQDVQWHGKIVDVVEDSGRKTSTKLSKWDLRIKMKPSESALADIVLRLPKDLAEQAIKKYPIGTYIEFDATAKFLGGGIGDHILDLKTIKKYRKKAGKKK